MNEGRDNNFMRIKAPALNNSTLIRDNVLTFIGRLNKRCELSFHLFHANRIFNVELSGQIWKTFVSSLDFTKKSEKSLR